MTLSLVRQRMRNAIQRDPANPVYRPAPMLTLMRRGVPIGFIFDDKPGVLMLQTYLPESDRRRILAWARNETGNQALTITHLGPPVERKRATATDI